MYLNQIQLNLIKLQWLLPFYRPPNTFSSFTRANHFWMLVFLVFAHVSFCALVSFSAFVLADYVLDHCQILEPHQSLAHNNIPLAHNWSSNIIYIYQCHILWCVIHYKKSMHLITCLKLFWFSLTWISVGLSLVSIRNVFVFFFRGSESAEHRNIKINRTRI